MGQGGRIVLFFAAFGSVFLLIFGISLGLPRTPSAILIVALLSGYFLDEMRHARSVWMDALLKAGYGAQKTFLGVNATVVHGAHTLDVHAPALSGRGRTLVTLRARPATAFPNTILVSASSPNVDKLHVVAADDAFSGALLTPRAREAARILLRTMGSALHHNEIILNEDGLEVRIVVRGASFIQPDAAHLRLLTRAACVLADEADRAVASRTSTRTQHIL